MKKIILLITFSFLINSCGSTKNVQTGKVNSTVVNVGKIKFSGGDGLSVDNAIVILNAKNSRDGIAAEYAYLEKILGKKFVEWTPLGQALIHENGKNYDVISVQKVSTEKKFEYYFDITSFFGKF